ncbi:MAG: gluconolactonase [Candidatus Rokubacteria bacterium RIFCSPHIGHO2_12_FULL_73_22]|nr:MAG: gluconolactonase [Candidatus Rokubacteria bacterium RIFCSPHIGHO2_12_FULL_73_22]OGL27522.1 MAG: gluconolactonase [Candidatus Rokubacteria bacterium RIFCSPLOWO2_12_FULL_73_47]
MVRGRQARTARQEVSYAFETLGTGFLFTEGPVWHPTGRFLLFSDMPGDHLRRWSAADGVTTFRRPCDMSNGLTWDRQGRLVVCEHATSRLTRTEPDGSIVPLASHWRGKQLNSPNDVVCRSDGGIYFSDPPYGRAKYYGVERPQELPFQGVYRVGPDPGAPELLADDFERPNGLCFSLDERRLFVNDTARQHIRVFDVAPDGGLRGGRLWAETKGDQPGAPDGMKLDAAGNVYCCGPGGIHVFDPDAGLLEVIEVPERTANFAWGDDDYRSLFITASTSLYRIRTTTPGRPVF